MISGLHAPTPLCVPKNQVRRTDVQLHSAQASDQVRFGAAKESLSKGDLLASNLLDALENGHRDVAIDLIKNPDTNLNFERQGGRTPLNTVIKAGDQELFDVMMAQNPQVNPVVKEYAETPFAAAIEAKQWGFVKTLLEKGANANQADRYGSRPLALDLPDSLIDLALEKGFDLNVRSGGMSVLMLGASTGSIGWMQKAIDAGQSIDEARTKEAGSSYDRTEKYTPIEFAITNDTPAVVDFLLSKSPKLKVASGHNLLNIAVTESSMNTFAQILKAVNNSAEFTAEEKKTMKEQALENALTSTQTKEIAEQLFTDGAGRDSAGKIRGELIFKTTNSAEMLKYILSKGVDVNATTGDNQTTALMEVASQISLSTTNEKLKILLDAGADVKLRDKKGNTAMMRARDTSSISRRKNYLFEYSRKTGDVLKAGGAKLSVVDRARLLGRRYNPLALLGRGFDNFIGGIRW